MRYRSRVPLAVETTTTIFQYLNLFVHKRKKTSFIWTIESH